MSEAGVHLRTVLALVLLVASPAWGTPRSPRVVAFAKAEQINLEALREIDGVSASIEQLESDFGESYSAVRIDYTGKDPVWLPLCEVELEPFQKGNFNCYTTIRTGEIDGNVRPEIELQLDNGDTRRFTGMLSERLAAERRDAPRVHLVPIHVGRFETPARAVMRCRMDGPGTLWVKAVTLHWSDRRLDIWLWEICGCLVAATAVWALATRRRLAKGECGILIRSSFAMLRAARAI